MAKRPAKRNMRGRRRRQSWFEKLLKRVPITEAQLRKGATGVFVCLLAAAGLFALVQAGAPEFMQTRFARIAAGAGYQVNRIEVRGVSRMDELKVYDTVLTEQERAMPMLDVDALREQLMTEFGWIQDARVSRQLPDTLIVDIVERTPAAAWRDGEQTMLIDADGVVLERYDPATDPGLVTLIGGNPGRQAPRLRELLDRAPALAVHVEQAEWVGNRRWNLTFKGGETLALPEGREAEQRAFLTFARLDGVNRLLGSGMTWFDLRDPSRAYFRKPDAPASGAEGQQVASAGDGGER